MAYLNYFDAERRRERVHLRKRAQAFLLVRRVRWPSSAMTHFEFIVVSSRIRPPARSALTVLTGRLDSVLPPIRHQTSEGVTNARREEAPCDRQSSFETVLGHLWCAPNILHSAHRRTATVRMRPPSPWISIESVITCVVSAYKRLTLLFGSYHTPSPPKTRFERPRRWNDSISVLDRVCRALCNRHQSEPVHVSF